MYNAPARRQVQAVTVVSQMTTIAARRE